MIRRIEGKVLELESDGALVDVGGWGVFVSCPVPETLSIGDTVIFHTYLAVKQDGVELYGFTSILDLKFFTLTLSVPGVGPKTALSFLRRSSREALQGAIAKRDVTYLTKVAGLGKKTAEKMFVELSDKMQSDSIVHDDEDTEIFDTLVALGYTEREARKTLTSIPKTILGKDARLRAALSQKSS